MKDGFVLTYVKDGILYPIMITESQNRMFQILAQSVVDSKVRLVNRPFGEAVNLLEKDDENEK